jgi:DnaK suppressor protein
MAIVRGKRKVTRKAPSGRRTARKVIAKKATTKRATTKRRVGRPKRTTRVAGRKTTTSRKKVARKKVATKRVVRRGRPSKVKKTGVKKVSARKTKVSKRKTKGSINRVIPKKRIIKPVKATRSRRSARRKTIQPVEAETQEQAAELYQLRPVSYQEETGESYMNVEQRIHFRHLLEQWKEQLLADMDQTVHHLHEAQSLPDVSDRATQEEAFNVELRTRDREHNLIKKIEEALQKLDTQAFGYCESCGAEIGIKRLEARPTATLCIDCKTLDELKERL